MIISKFQKSSEVQQIRFEMFVETRVPKRQKQYNGAWTR